MKRIIESPFANGNASLQIRPKTMTFRKEEFEVFDYFYICNATGREFTTEKAGDVTMSQLYNQYREKHTVMFPVEIKELREKYDLSPVKMSDILGFGINIYRNYENGEVPSKSNAKMLDLAKDPKIFLDLSAKSDSLSATELDSLKLRTERISTQIHEQSLKKCFSIFSDEINQFTGFKKKEFEKIGNMVLYFISKNDRTYKTRLNKYLFYSDFLSYKYIGKPMSGFVYSAIDKGPVPDSYEMLYDLLEKDKYFNFVEFEVGENEYSKLIPGKDINFSKFHEEEIEILNNVLYKLQYKKTNDIIEDTHKLKCWQDNISTKSSISYQKYALEIELD